MSIRDILNYLRFYFNKCSIVTFYDGGCTSTIDFDPIYIRNLAQNLFRCALDISYQNTEYTRLSRKIFNDEKWILYFHLSLT